MKKISYSSGEVSEIKTPEPSQSEGLNNTENGARGFSLSETKIPEEYDNSDSEEDPNSKNIPGMQSDQSIKIAEEILLEKLINLGDAFDVDGLDSFANFTDFLIQKVGIALKVDPTDLFNSMIVKIRRADISDTNHVIKKLTKIYSRTILLEYMKNNDMNKSKESAYKKVLHRANQYLLEE